jgi:hypothetical protein
VTGGKGIIKKIFYNTWVYYGKLKYLEIYVYLERKGDNENKTNSGKSESKRPCDRGLGSSVKLV